MSYRFLPWVRRGLAARIADPDPLTADPPARARFPVRVTVSTGAAASVDLRLFGPGDVVGVDPRTIVRTEPARFARNFPPDQMVAVEFDPPDLPWMFTPAAPGAGDRLRPWLVLVVAAVQPGVEVTASAARPLPALHIEAPAVPGDELPDLAESWAWAHASVVEAAPPPSVAEHLAANPNLNVSRLLCPRRLEPGRDYLAGLVPAFEAGRLAGLGLEVPAAAATTAPAWGAAGSVGAEITLPLYFHWEFRTGPAGDFESLARRLTPRPVPDTVGFRRMAVTGAHPALPPLDPERGGIVKLEGALRAPEAGSGDPLPAELQPWVDALVELLNLPAGQVVDGASPEAESVAPPIYGGQHVKVHTLDAGSPGWLNELNTDPRHRASAGLATEVVRLNQERFMQAAWEQVGDVVEANARLDRARLVREVAERIHRRHVDPLPEPALLSLTAPVHRRVLSDGRPLVRVLERSHLPSGVLDGAFRRLGSPRSMPLTRAARVAGLTRPTGPAGGRAGRTVAAVPVPVVAELARGEHPFDILAAVPDGLVGSRLFDRLPAQPTAEVGGELGLVGSVPAATLTGLRAAQRELERSPVPATVVLRGDLAISGIVLPPLSDLVAGVVGGVLEGGPVSGVVGQLLDASRREAGVVGFAVERDGAGDGRAVRVLVRRDEAGTLSVRPLGGRGAPPPAFDRPVTGPARRARPAGVPTVAEVAAVIGRPPSLVLPAPLLDVEVIGRFSDAFDAHRRALGVEVASVIPPPVPLDLDRAHTVLSRAVDPSTVVVTRASLAVRLRGRALAEALADGSALSGPEVRQREPLDPVMIGPLLPEPLYAPLADADPDRFLPGIGRIPDDTVTMLETNPRFVEAFLVGANHEMNRELLWRGFPTDRRGTPFHRFWDRTDGREDIGPVHAFSPTVPLGSHSGADQRGSLVLLVRGQLLRRYPNAVISAVPARPDGGLDLDPARAEDPIFWGRIQPDVTFVGFDLAREDVEVAPGWYFVIAEQPTEPRFGLDVPPEGPAGGPPASWSDLHWGHVGVAPGGHLRLAGSGLAQADKPIIAGRPARARFGRTAADMAAITFQRPFRAAIHSSEVIAGASPAGGAPVRPVLAHAVLLRPLTLGGGG